MRPGHAAAELRLSQFTEAKAVFFQTIVVGVNEEIKAAGLQKVVEFAVVVIVKIHLYVRADPGEPLQVVLQEDDFVFMVAAHGYDRFFTPRRLALADGLLSQGQDLFGFWVKILTGGRGGGAPGAAVEDRADPIALPYRHLLRERGRRGVEEGGGAGKASLFDNGGEAF